MNLLASEVRPLLPSDETLREATLADRQIVLDLDTNVHFGLDYLPLYYDDYIHNSNGRCYIYEKQGRVVGFIRSWLVDDGETLMTGASRLAHDLRGDGMFGRFVRRVLEEWRGSPKLQHMATAVGLETDTDKKERLLKTYREVLERHITALQLDLAELRKRFLSGELSHKRSSELRLLSYSDVNTMMHQRPDQLRHLFPEQRLFLRWVPLQIVEANAGEMFAERRKTIATMTSPIEDAAAAATTAAAAAAETTAAVTASGAFPVTFMSSAVHFPCKSGRVLHLDMFGSGSDADLFHHVDWHLLHLAETRGEEETAIVHVYYTRRVDDMVEKLQRKFPVQVFAGQRNKKALALVMDYAK